jgi:DNA-binding protein Fis
MMSPEGELSSDFLPYKIKRHPLDFLEPRNLKATISGIEIHLIKKALAKFGGNQVKAAKLLGVPEATLRFKMKKYSIPKE